MKNTIFLCIKINRLLQLYIKSFSVFSVCGLFKIRTGSESSAAHKHYVSLYLFNTVTVISDLPSLWLRVFKVSLRFGTKLLN